MNENLIAISNAVPALDSLIVGQQNTIAALTQQIADLKSQPSPIVLAGLEQNALWIQDGTTGNNGGGDPNATPIGVMTPGTPATFKTTAQVKYNNPYWYLQLEKIAPEINNAAKFTYDLAFMFPTQADLDACQAVEFEVQQKKDGLVYNMAWQMPLKQYKQWKTFNYTTKVWEFLATPFPVDFNLIAPGKYLSVKAEYMRDPVAKTLTHTALTLNGVKTVVNVTRAATPRAGTDNVHAAYQLDTNGLTPPTSYKTLVKGMKVTAL